MSTVFFDVDTQRDFVEPGGALYVPGAEAIVPQVALLNRYAAAHGIPVIATMDAHSPQDAEFRQYPPHCLRGAPGQQKPEETRLPGQIIVEKQVFDCFSNPELPRILERLHATHAVVYGVVTEICVRQAALGLLARGIDVEVVLDAVKSLDETQAEAFFAELERAGGRLTTVARVTGA
jgi:nicotinamidase/pyrazinamidase